MTMAGFVKHPLDSLLESFGWQLDPTRRAYIAPGGDTIITMQSLIESRIAGEKGLLRLLERYSDKR